MKTIWVCAGVWVGLDLLAACSGWKRKYHLQDAFSVAWFTIAITLAYMLAGYAPWG